MRSSAIKHIRPIAMNNPKRSDLFILENRMDASVTIRKKPLDPSLKVTFPYFTRTGFLPFTNMAPSKDVPRSAMAVRTEFLTSANAVSLPLKTSFPSFSMTR